MKVMVAMSGGVDSSVAALLLREEGHEVVGVTMCLGVASTPGGPPACCGEDAIADARSVCDRLGIAHHVLDFSSALEEKVVAPFAAAYAGGRTPNPCVDCNRHLKFGSLLDTALALGFEALATGHYARLVEGEGGPLLARGRDRVKDQSYFLAMVPAERFRHVIFPLGELAKEEVRRRAEEAGLPVSLKPESQEICFVGGGGYVEFLANRGVAPAPGPIVDIDGREVGRHPGLANFTVGQRGGLGVSAPRPLYVLEKRMSSNSLVVGPREMLGVGSLVATEPNLFIEPMPAVLTARIRHRGREAGCRAEIRRDELRVEFLEEAEGVAPGQTVVLYDGEVVVAAGVILVGGTNPSLEGRGRGEGGP